MSFSLHFIKQKLYFILYIRKKKTQLKSVYLKFFSENVEIFFEYPVYRELKSPTLSEKNSTK